MNLFHVLEYGGIQITGQIIVAAVHASEAVENVRSNRTNVNEMSVGEGEETRVSGKTEVSGIVKPQEAWCGEWRGKPRPPKEPSLLLEQIGM